MIAGVEILLSVIEKFRGIEIKYSKTKRNIGVLVTEYSQSSARNFRDI